jgi:hypothetical protein
VSPGDHLRPIAVALGEVNQSLVGITRLLAQINNVLGRFDAELAHIELAHADQDGENWTPTAREYTCDDDDKE